MSRNLNIWGVFWMNQVQMGQNAVGRQQVGGIWVHLLGDQEACARVILVLREYTWNAPAVSLVLLAFDDTRSWFLFRARWSILLFKWFHPTLGDCLPFP